MPPPDPQPDWVLERRQVLGRRIRNARVDANLTQERLAEHAGVGVQTIYRIEYGTTDASISALLRIAVAVRVPVEDLLRSDAGKDSQN